jgi:hypothetical protein
MAPRPTVTVRRAGDGWRAEAGASGQWFEARNLSGLFTQLRLLVDLDASRVVFAHRRRRTGRVVGRHAGGVAVGGHGAARGAGVGRSAAVGSGWAVQPRHRRVDWEVPSTRGPASPAAPAQHRPRCRIRPTSEGSNATAMSEFTEPAKREPTPQVRVRRRVLLYIEQPPGSGMLDGWRATWTHAGCSRRTRRRPGSTAPA